MKRLFLLLTFLIPFLAFGQGTVIQQNPVAASGPNYNKQVFQWANGSFINNLKLPFGPTPTYNNAASSNGMIWMKPDSSLWGSINGTWVQLSGNGSSSLYFSSTYFAGDGLTPSTALTVINSDKWGTFAVPSVTGNTGKVLSYNGSTFSWITPGGGGTVTSITPGYGFTSNTPITTSGTMTIDSNKFANASDEILTGMVTTMTTNTNAQISAGTARIAQTIYSFVLSNITVPSQDATLRRYSIIYATTNSTLGIVNGTLATDPQIPNVPAGDLLVSIIYIPSVADGGSTTSTGGNGKGIQTLTFTAPTSTFSVTGSPANKANSSLSISFTTQSANKVFAGPTSGGAATPTWRSLVAGDLPAGTGTVTSVALSLPSFITVSGSPVTTSGTLTGTLATQTAWTIFGNGTGSTTAPTFFAPSLTSALFANQGATTTVLHGNATGNPSFSAVSLTADVSGILPIANGGTGTSSPGLVAGTNITITGSWPNQTVNSTGGGGLTTSNFVFNEVPSGSINGTNATFTLANTPTTGTVVLYLNGLEQVSGTDYTISSSTITWLNVPPQTGYTLRANYLK